MSIKQRDRKDFKNSRVATTINLFCDEIIYEAKSGSVTGSVVRIHNKQPITLLVSLQLKFTKSEY
jgi:hypothetical protein